MKIDIGHENATCIQLHGQDLGSGVPVLLVLLRRLRMPVIVTLHTVLERPNPAQKKVMDEIISIAGAVIVMSEMGADILERVHGVDPEAVDAEVDPGLVDIAHPAHHVGVLGEQVVEARARGPA
mgnify:CR=1 FL=1